MHQRGVVQQNGEAIQFPSRRQIAPDEEKSGLPKGRILRQLLHRDAAVAQDAFLPIHEGDGTGATAGIGVTAVQRDQA